MNISSAIKKIDEGLFDQTLKRLYPGEKAENVRARYTTALGEFASLYGRERDVSIFSVPGRSELAGNHTDHNHGSVIAASVDLDIIAVASPNEDNVIRVKSEGFPEDIVDINKYTSPAPARFGRSDALIAGVCAGFRAAGHSVGGFDAYTTSNVLKGSGLSSSAAFEDMIGTILTHFYNESRIGYIEISKISQYAENKFFGKPCGLMDQIACAAGGIVSIDFADTESPVVERFGFDFTGAGYCLCIVDTGGNHADLTPDYAAVPAEMKSVAAFFGKNVLREVDEDSLLSSIPALREKCGDRAVLRALHFFAENRRVAALRSALDASDLDAYFAGVLESGRSSFCYLQNVFTTSNVAEQGVSLALCLSERLLSGCRSAFRVHGGGFAGTVQAYVPSDRVDEYRDSLDAVFGKGACTVLHIRPDGAIRIV